MGKERILVVDDERRVAEMCKKYLTTEGYQVETAYTGADALKLSETASFDVVVTDVRMPGINGLDLIRTIKQFGKETGVVVITGNATLNTALEAMKLGASGFVIKPFTLEELFSAVSHATEKVRLLKENIRLKGLVSLFDLSRALFSEEDLDRLSLCIVQSCLEMTKAHRCSLLLIDDETGRLCVKAERGFSEGDAVQIPHHMWEDLSHHPIATGLPLLLQEDGRPDAGEENGKIMKTLTGTGLFAVLSVPLLSRETEKGRVIGVIHLFKTKKGLLFTEEDLELVSVLGSQVVIAIESVASHSRFHENWLKALSALFPLIEKKAHPLSSHYIGVARYAVALAKGMGLSPRATREVELVGLLHDIGLLKTPEKILLKPGKLTPEEYKVVKEHPTDATRILEERGFPRPIIEGVRHHHEWYSGEGYPAGLSGETIPVSSRIVAVADAVDAMLSDRPYRKALPMSKVIAELKRTRGVQFDPSIADVCIAFLSGERG